MRTVGDLMGLFQWLIELVQTIFGFFNKKDEEAPAE